MPDPRIRSHFPALLLAAAIFVPAPAGAQPAVAAPASQPTSRLDPLDAAADVPAIRVRPAFAGYHGLADEKVGPWQEANDTVGRIGGWRAYAREAAAPDDEAPARAPVPATGPAAPARSGDPVPEGGRR